MPRVCWMCNDDKFTFSEHPEFGVGVAPCSCCESDIRHQFEDHPAERADILRKYAITPYAIKVAEDALERGRKMNAERYGSQN